MELYCQLWQQLGLPKQYDGLAFYHIETKFFVSVSNALTLVWKCNRLLNVETKEKKSENKGRSKNIFLTLHEFHLDNSLTIQT